MYPHPLKLRLLHHHMTMTDHIDTKCVASLVAARSLAQQGCIGSTYDDAKSDHANWVIPGKLMCGPYPGMDGVNFPTLDDAKDNIKRLLDDGIDMFVCLQSEIEMLMNGSGNKHPYFPEFEHYMVTLRDNFRCADKIAYHEFRIHDQQCPTKYHLVREVAVVCDAIMKGRNVYVHCAGGHGRTGLFVSCILQAIFAGHDTDTILSYVQHVHDRRKKHDMRCKNMMFVQTPNTREQRQLVRDFGTFIQFLA